MVRIYAVLEDVGSEYETLAPTQISLKPFDDDCYYLDLEENKSYDTVIYEGGWDNIDWKPFNVIYQEYMYFDKHNNKFLYEDDLTEDWDDKEILEGCRCQQYKNGKPIGEPYFEE